MECDNCMGNKGINPLLSKLVPENNVLSVAFASNGNNGAKAPLLEALYGSGFVGAFVDNDESPEWARRAAVYMEDDFFHNTPGRKHRFSDVASQLADGDGERHINCRYALEQWEANGKQGPEPYTTAQDYGSCVDASASEHETTMFGYRAVQPNLGEVFKFAAAWYKYANRGYCSDGWGGSGIAAVARRVGCAFRTSYSLGSVSVDFTDDDENENIVARRWCRSGIPDELAEYTQANHGYEDGAITAYDGDHRGFKKVMKAGGVLHAGGVRTSGGSKPFTTGRTGPHMQSTVGYDDTDECRQWFKDTHNITWAVDDFPLVNHQTWGRGWRGECGDSYWPKHLWGPEPQGAWVCSAKWWLGDVEYAWLPWAKGFPGAPEPGPVVVAPPITGTIYADGVSVKAIRGNPVLTMPDGTQYTYTIVPDGAGNYRFQQTVLP